MMPDDTVYLQHILDAIQKIDMYLAGIDEPSFYAHSLIQDGVIRQLEIIGEAVKRILPATRSSAPHIPWLAIAGMRDKLIHHYFGVDLKQVWLAVLTDVPTLKTTVTALLATRQANQRNKP